MKEYYSNYEECSPEDAESMRSRALRFLLRGGIILAIGLFALIAIPNLVASTSTEEQPSVIEARNFFTVTVYYCDLDGVNLCEPDHIVVAAGKALEIKAKAFKSYTTNRPTIKIDSVDSDIAVSIPYEYEAPEKPVKLGLERRR